MQYFDRALPDGSAGVYGGEGRGGTEMGGLGRGEREARREGHGGKEDMTWVVEEVFRKKGEMCEGRQRGRDGGEMEGGMRRRKRERVGGREGGRSQEYIKIDALYGRPPTWLTSKYRRVRLL